MNFQMFIPWIKVGALFIFLIAVMIGGMWYIMVYKKRRRWHIEIHEQKTDGRIHSIGRDTLEERTKDWGTKTFYFLKRKHKIAMPPPDEIVDRSRGGKEEIDYLQIERQLFPAEKIARVNYHAPFVNAKIQENYMKVIADVFKNKPSVVHDKYMYIPIHKTLVAGVDFKPIPYSVQLTAQRQTQIAQDFFKNKTDFWQQYGGAIVIGLVVVLAIVAVVLTYDFVSENIGQMLARADATTNALNKIAENLGMSQAKPPS